MCCVRIARVYIVYKKSLKYPNLERTRSSYNTVCTRSAILFVRRVQYLFGKCTPSVSHTTHQIDCGWLWCTYHGLVYSVYCVDTCLVQVRYTYTFTYPIDTVDNLFYFLVLFLFEAHESNCVAIKSFFFVLNAIRLNITMIDSLLILHGWTVHWIYGIESIAR